MARLSWVLLAVIATLAPRAAALDEVGDASCAFIGSASRSRADGRQNRILLGLRDLRDPALAPFYEHLTSSKQATLQVHGMLGLAEVSPGKQLALARLVEIEPAAVQAQIVAAAIDLGLLGDDQARQILAWQGMDPGVKLLVSLRRFRTQDPIDAALLHESLQASQFGRRGLAALMLHQLGDPAGTEALAAINASTAKERDVARAMLLQSAAKNGFDRIGPWAYAVAVEPGVDEPLALLALRTAIRFGERRAVDLWTEQFTQATDPARQIRLGVTALWVAPWSPPELFAPLEASTDPVLQQLGATGRTVAAAGPDGGGVAEEVVGLLLLHHPLANAWALEYAREWATPQDAQLIYLGLIKAFEEGPPQTQPRRVNETVQAAKLLHERFPEVGAAVLRPMLADAATPVATQQAILMGLLQSDADTHPLIESLSPPKDPELASLFLILKATSGQELGPSEMSDLRLLARGGGMLRDELRAQACWVYLTRSGQVRQAIAELVK